MGLGLLSTPSPAPFEQKARIRPRGRSGDPHLDLKDEFDGRVSSGRRVFD